MPKENEFDNVAQNSLTNINIENFNGPLDLLLALVKEKNMNLLDINLAELATDYLRIIKDLKENDFEIAADYLVMSATLIQMKARMLLVEKELLEDAEIEEDKAKLIKLLAEYQQFKPIFDVLKQRESKRLNIYIKKVSNLEPFIRPTDRSKVDGRSSKAKLTQIIKMMFERLSAEKLRQVKIDSISVTPDEQKNMIRTLFYENEEIHFNKIFSLPTLKHFVITFIAMLDMSRNEELIISQEQQFGEIKVKKGINYEK
ncbi:segregation/condensation protein A [Mesomycoplasma neurolyticum]|uniref:Segregation and condensation protein A n=1 Tax=Mesomycoplasma neurolyticum TaxID=2120 RepID=A0A449A651_9BACT|nr:segregation/condensation protein A [Mesomycoplasma neurolyticum]VEU59716.1 segregation and condensation protein A [Mesomycoplasma neurolyticum]